MNIITKSDTSRRRIAAVGMYDGVHAGHQFLIDYLRREAASRGLTPAVITFTRHPLTVVRPLEKPGLLTSLEDRLSRLESAGIDDIILLTFNDKIRFKSAREFLSGLRKTYGVDALVLGFNNHFGHDRPQTFADYVKIGSEVGVDIISAPEYRGPGSPVSSSAIRRLLLDGKPEKAAEALGYTYALRGIVVEGRKLGRQLGFPTANIRISDSDLLIPKPGVYAAIVVTPDGERRQAMVNIGYRPTVTDPATAAEPSLEAHILDFKGYLYEEEVTIRFVSYLRSECRFDTTEMLREQLVKDAAAVRKLLANRH